jgi:starch synthase
MAKKAEWENAGADDLSVIKTATYSTLSKLAINWADAVVKAEPGLDADIVKHAVKSGKPLLEHTGEDYADAYSDFYNEIMELEGALVDE